MSIWEILRLSEPWTNSGRVWNRSLIYIPCLDSKQQLREEKSLNSSNTPILTLHCFQKIWTNFPNNLTQTMQTLFSLNIEHLVRAGPWSGLATCCWDHGTSDLTPGNYRGPEITDVSNLATSPLPPAPAQNSHTVVTRQPGTQFTLFLPTAGVTRAEDARLVTGRAPAIPRLWPGPGAAWWLVLAAVWGADPGNQSPSQLWTVRCWPLSARYPG